VKQYKRVKAKLFYMLLKKRSR